jgi:hypothetical protein
MLTLSQKDVRYPRKIIILTGNTSAEPIRTGLLQQQHAGSPEAFPKLAKAACTCWSPAQRKN